MDGWKTKVSWFRVEQTRLVDGGFWAYRGVSVSRNWAWGRNVTFSKAPDGSKLPHHAFSLGFLHFYWR